MHAVDEVILVLWLQKAHRRDYFRDHTFIDAFCAFLFKENYVLEGFLQEGISGTYASPRIGACFLTFLHRAAAGNL